jgi:hypothetical protein
MHVMCHMRRRIHARSRGLGARACFSSLAASPLRFETANPTPPQSPASAVSQATECVLYHRMCSLSQNVFSIFSSPRRPRSLLAVSQAGLFEH